MISAACAGGCGAAFPVVAIWLGGAERVTDPVVCERSLVPSACATLAPGLASSTTCRVLVRTTIPAINAAAAPKAKNLIIDVDLRTSLSGRLVLVSAFATVAVAATVSAPAPEGDFKRKTAKATSSCSSAACPGFGMPAGSALSGQVAYTSGKFNVPWGAGALGPGAEATRELKKASTASASVTDSAGVSSIACLQ